MTLRDLRWKLAYAAWAPGSYVEHLIRQWQDPYLRRTTNLPARMRVALGISPRLPLRYRVLRVLVVSPSTWLSDLIYQDWVADERASSSYWKKAP